MLALYWLVSLLALLLLALWRLCLCLRQGQEQLLWDASELAKQQGFDWDAYYSRDRRAAHQFPNAAVSEWTMCA